MRFLTTSKKSPLQLTIRLVNYRLLQWSTTLSKTKVSSSKHLIVVVLKIWNHREYLNRNHQCSQWSRGPTGPGGRTAKSPGPDGTAENMPSSSANLKTAVFSEDDDPAIWATNTQGVQYAWKLRVCCGNCSQRWGTAGDDRGLRVTTCDRRQPHSLWRNARDGRQRQGIVGDCRERRGNVGDSGTLLANTCDWNKWWDAVGIVGLRGE